MRRLTAITAIIVTVLFMMPRAASAQAKKGDKEFQVFGNVFTTITPKTTFKSGSTTITSGGTSSTGILFLNVGQFFTDQVEVGGGPNITISSSDPTFDVGINFFLRYFLGEQSAKIKPYVGAEYQIQSFNPPTGQSVSDQTFLSGVGGVRDYLSEKAAIDIKAAFGFNPSNAGSLQLFNVSIGLTLLFGN